MKKCKQLQDENEELGRQVAESQETKIAQQLALQQSQFKELHQTLQGKLLLPTFLNAQMFELSRTFW